jgi:putative oxidoreductase
MLNAQPRLSIYEELLMPETSNPAAFGGRLPTRIRATTPSWLAFSARVLGGLIFLGTGTAKEVSSSFYANWAAMVEQLHVPLSDVAIQVTPILEIIIGALLLLGLFARIASIAGLLVMLGAAWAHLTVEPDALPTGLPPAWLPVVTVLVCAFVLWRGAGAWSLDRRDRQRAATADPATR